MYHSKKVQAYIQRHLNKKEAKITKTQCRELAKTCVCLTDFKEQYPDAYRAARRNKWTGFFKNATVPKWKERDCYREAKKYTSWHEFRKYSPWPYQKSLINGWAEKYTWLGKDFDPGERIYTVYKYEDLETQTVYVGLTCDIKTRHKSHATGIFCGKVKKTAVLSYFSQANKPVPEPVIIAQGLYVTDAQKLEAYWIDFFRKEGWNVLNKQRGGGIGPASGWALTHNIKPPKE